MDWHVLDFARISRADVVVVTILHDGWSRPGIRRPAAEQDRVDDRLDRTALSFLVGGAAPRQDRVTFVD